MSKSLDLKLRKEVMDRLDQYSGHIKNLNINHVGYREFFDDGTSIAFCSKEEWYEIAPYSEEMNADMSIHYALELISLKQNGFDYIIRSISSANNRFLEQLLLQDMCNSLLIYKKEDKMIKMFSFIAARTNTAALNYFFNYRSKFEAIINLYKNDLAYIFKKEEYQALRKPLFNKNVTNGIFDKTYGYGNNKIILTPREEECVMLLIKGARDKDIANCLGISPRTASQHVASIKKKLKTNNRFEITKIVNNDIL